MFWKSCWLAASAYSSSALGMNARELGVVNRFQQQVPHSLKCRPWKAGRCHGAAPVDGRGVEASRTNRSTSGGFDQQTMGDWLAYGTAPARAGRHSSTARRCAQSDERMCRTPESRHHSPDPLAPNRQLTRARFGRLPRSSKDRSLHPWLVRCQGLSYQIIVSLFLY